MPLYDGLIVWPHPEEEPTIVFEDGGYGNAFKLIENGLLAFDDVDELGNKDHRLGNLIANRGFLHLTKYHLWNPGSTFTFDSPSYEFT